MFIGFANFYWRFIRRFSKIVALLISILKTTGLFKKSAPKTFKVGNNEVVWGDSDRANETVIDLSKFKNEKSRKLTCIPNIGATREPNFLTLDAKKDFNHLWLAFIKALIFWYFNPRCYIWIKTDVLGYIISGVLSQLNLNSYASPNNFNKSDFGQWYSIVIFLERWFL